MTDVGAPDLEPVRLQLDAHDISNRARSAYGPDGRLTLPHTAHWPIFPFEVDGVRMRLVGDPVLPEPPRHGEDPQECSTCHSGDDRFVWSDRRWRVSMSDEPMSLPTLMLHTREHIDFDALTDEAAAEMGVRLIWMQRALASIEGVGRVHVAKWGDGGAHLHIFVIARPRGMLQLKGMFLTTWLHALPPLRPELWTAIRAHVRTALEAAAGVGGEPM
ncbi:MAG: hypothetical protein KY451_07465 [Actinobacteria bacterium]|nr:hypothetical protein [Actinomycetota bacterium]